MSHEACYFRDESDYNMNNGFEVVILSYTNSEAS